MALAGIDGLEAWFLLNPRLRVATEVRERFGRAGTLAASDDASLPRDAVYHVPSPLEPSPLARVWPRRLRSLPLVVTLHDLIPGIFPKENMPDAGVRRAYWARLELARHAARVLSVSRATANDAIRILGLRADRMRVTGGGVSPEFRPPDDVEAVRRVVRDRYPRVRGEFILFTGGMDYRKNVRGLVQAYAALPRQLRERFTLVIVGRLALDDATGAVPEQARALEIGEHVVATGHVPDDELVELYQAASLFVFPSRYEGFGLPVIEALACGAPALAGRNSSLVELVDDDSALFDAGDANSIRDALARALDDPDLLARLRRPEIRERFTWQRIAELTARTYAELARS